MAQALADESAQNQPKKVVMWHQNVPAWRLFCALRTQVRSGPSGPIGLDYTAIPFVRRSAGLSEKEAIKAMPGLKIAESEWLEIVAEEIRKANE